MPTDQHTAAQLEEVVRLADYRAGREAVFPSDESLRWFVRQHGPVLIEAGALTRPTGAWLVRPAVFDRVVAEVGARRAAADMRGRRAAAG